MSEGESATVVGELEFVSKSYDGWFWATLVTIQGGKKVPIKVTGNLEGFRKGSHVVVTGTWNEHPKYGRQIKVDSVVYETPSTEEGVLSWLQEHLPQVGPVRSKEMVKKFGTDLWDVIENDPTRIVDEIAGITQERVNELVVQYQRYKHTREQQTALYASGYTQKEASTIVRSFQAQAAATGARPHFLYLLGLLSFSRAEFIGARVGVPSDDKLRMRASVLEYATQESGSSGHTVFDEETLLSGASDLIGFADPIALREGIYALVTEGGLKALGGKTFMPTNAYYSEMSIAMVVEEFVRF